MRSASSPSDGCLFRVLVEAPTSSAPSLTPQQPVHHTPQRDIPMPLVTSGVEKGNLRELALARMAQLGLRCRCVPGRMLLGVVKEAGWQDAEGRRWCALWIECIYPWVCADMCKTPTLAAYHPPKS